MTWWAGTANERPPSRSSRHRWTARHRFRLPTRPLKIRLELGIDRETQFLGLGQAGLRVGYAARAHVGQCQIGKSQNFPIGYSDLVLRYWNEIVDQI